MSEFASTAKNSKTASLDFLSTMWPQSHKRAEIFAVIGAHFLMAPLAFTWVCGNLMTYMNSFFHYQCYPECYDGDPQWIINTHLVLIGLGLFGFDFIKRRIGLRWTCIIAILSHNTAYMVSAWTVQTSVMTTCVFMGVGMGLGVGLATNAGFMYINIWAPKNSRVYMVSITSIGPMLSIVQNQIITMVVNPRNLKPNAQQGLHIFFSEPQILQRVPTVIFLLGLMTFVLQLIGYLLVSAPKIDQISAIPPHEEERKDKLRSVCPKQEEEVKLIVAADKNENTIRYVEPIVLADKPKAIDTLNCKPYPKCIREKASEGNKNLTELSNAVDAQDVVVDISQGNVTDCENMKEDQVQYKPSQALKTAAFWSIWLYGASLGLCTMLMDSFYKLFGLLYIPNDELLTLLGCSMPALVCVSRIVFAVLLKHRPLDVTNVGVFSLMLSCLTTTLWFFAARIHEAVYMCLILLMAISSSFIYFVLANGTLQEFGKENFATIYALAYSGLPITSFVSALYLTPLLNAAGWFWLFLSSSLLSFTALIFNIFTSIIFPWIKYS